MKKLFFVIFCSVINLLIIFSCNTKGNCKKLIVHTWQKQNIEIIDEIKFREDYKKGLKKSLQKQGIDPESERGITILSQLDIDDYIFKLKNLKVNMEFTLEGKIIFNISEENVNNSEKNGYYKLSNNCEYIFITEENNTDTLQIKYLSDDKLILGNDDIITTYKSLN